MKLLVVGGGGRAEGGIVYDNLVLTSASVESVNRLLNILCGEHAEGQKGGTG